MRLIFIFDAMKSTSTRMLGAVLLTLSGLTSGACARTLCTIAVDAASGKVVTQSGECNTRVTPASTFKIALSLMGFDSGFLKDEHHPALAFRRGDPDWGGQDWTQDTDPARWMKYSVVWYSQRITHALGAQRLQRYAQAFGFGNADLSGDPGLDNGLERAWISSSLKISPAEQIAFLRKLAMRMLPVSAQALDMTYRITTLTPLAEGWELHGKTGAAFPRRPDGSNDRARGYGWFVGWMSRSDKTVVFVRLTQDERLEQGSPGIRARDAFLKELPGIGAAALH